MAVFSIHPGKGPGPDGFSSSFYQSFWTIIGEDVCRSIRSFFETSYLHPRQNETHVRLIPKISGPRKVGDYRPIALCNTHYKIIAKILTGRLQPILPELISPFQCAFVPNRAISDNVLITHEILHFLRTSEAKKFCSMAVKTDMSKAYDRIEWGFLKSVLEKLGFSERWISWISACVSSVSYSFLINGSPQGQVIPSRGLRQGDPLSPYLFILCTEVLSGLCVKAQDQGILSGIKVSRASPPVNHLLFADDTMFFCKSNARCCQALTQILAKYEKVSGQCINLTKSTITFSSKTPAEAKVRVKNSLNITQEGGLGNYLGLPENFGRKKRDIFASIVDKVRQRVHSWPGRFLSGAGKQVLLTTVLTALPIYPMSCFKLPVSLCKQIQSVLTRFWWDDKPEVKKMCWVSWESLTQPKYLGGLGFRDLEKFNDALLAKTGWRLLTQPDSLLTRVLLGKYCNSSSFLECSATPRVASHGWRSILTGRELLLKGLGWSVGNGACINVWRDAWLSLDHSQAPFGPPTADTAELKVQDLLCPVTNDWNVDVIRQILPQYEEPIRKLITSYVPSTDALVWLPENSGSYSTKSGYAIAKQFQQQSTIDSFNWNKQVWQTKLPPKLKNFLWKIAAGALPLGSNLVKRGMVGAANCKRCSLESRTLCGPTKPFHTHVRQTLVTKCSRSCEPPPCGVSLTPLVPWIMWNLWTARNLLLFENRVYSAIDVMHKAITDARQWQEAQLAIPKPSQRPLEILTPTTSAQSHVCFVDAAWCPASGSSGAGWILKDQSELILSQASATRPFVPSALAAEALAIRSALFHITSIAHFSSIRSLKICSDSQVLIKLLKTNGTHKELKGILHDIRCLQNSFSSILFSYISRSNNMEVDALAKSALSASVLVTNSSLSGV
ncbi:PREDICTED: uncharacterized protein LOC104748447 [Camelina sativa]|uniref:Uncharacterized protein LOC104748447 n=1 Tax=Camelina sativa TaxID=90675 RepID=A0ABM1QF04_CAMSA|nr:PREDICTED: uncharacterized protein LOC104748447 [Camelina sativa]